MLLYHCVSMQSPSVVILEPKKIKSADVYYAGPRACDVWSLERGLESILPGNSAKPNDALVYTFGKFRNIKGE